MSITHYYDNMPLIGVQQSYDNFPNVYDVSLYTRVDAYYNLQNAKVSYELSYYLHNNTNEPYTVKIAGLAFDDTTYIQLANGSKKYFALTDYATEFQYGFSFPTITIPSNGYYYIATATLADNAIEYPGDDIYIYKRYISIYPEGDDSRGFIECESNNTRLKIPNSKVEPSYLTVFPDLFFPTNVIKLELKNNSNVSSSQNSFWDGNYFYHKIYLLVDGGHSSGELYTPEITVEGRSVDWTIPIEANDFYALLDSPDSPVRCEFEVETYTAYGTLVGRTYTWSTIQYLPQGAIDPDTNEIIFDGLWETTDDLTYELTQDRYTIIEGMSTVKFTVTGLGYFEGGFVATVINYDNDGHAMRQVGITNQTEFIFYQCAYPYFQVTVEAAGLTTTKRGGPGSFGGGGFIHYDKPTVTLRTTQLNRNGEMDIEIWGNVTKIKFDNGTTNTLKSVQYMYSNSEEDTGWIVIEPQIKEDSLDVDYTWSAHLTLTPGFNYNFIAKVEDSFFTIETQPVVAMYRPVFDWSQNDFKFNVPVTIEGPGIDNVLTISGGDVEIKKGCRFILHDALMPTIAVRQVPLESNFITPGRETAYGATYTVINDGFYDPQIIMHFYYSGVAEKTVDKLVFYLRELAYNYVPIDVHWQSGGGNVSGCKINLTGHSFSGWNIETVDGEKVITGRTCGYKGSDNETNEVSNYIGVTAGQTFHASGTIMFSATKVVW